MPFAPQIDLTSVKRLLGAVEQPGQFVIADSIVPTLDIGVLGLIHARETQFVFDDITAVNFFVSIAVPDKQFWLVHLISSASDLLDADQSIRLQAAVRLPGAAAALANSVVRIGRILTINASSSGGVGESMSPPLILPPGADVGVAANEVTVGAAGSVRTSLQLQVTRVRL